VIGRLVSSVSKFLGGSRSSICLHDSIEQDFRQFFFGCFEKAPLPGACTVSATRSLLQFFVAIILNWMDGPTDLDLQKVQVFFDPSGAREAVRERPRIKFRGMRECS
jgi:hypothetical protein